MSRGKRGNWVLLDVTCRWRSTDTHVMTASGCRALMAFRPGRASPSPACSPVVSRPRMRSALGTRSQQLTFCGTATTCPWAIGECHMPALLGASLPCNKTTGVLRDFDGESDCDVRTTERSARSASLALVALCPRERNKRGDKVISLADYIASGSIRALPRRRRAGQASRGRNSRPSSRRMTARQRIRRRREDHPSSQPQAHSAYCIQ